MKKIKLLIIPMILILLCGCENKECNEGKITGKLYKKPYTSYVISGKVIVPIKHKEKYLIELNQDCTFEVDEETFNSLNKRWGVY